MFTLKSPSHCTGPRSCFDQCPCLPPVGAGAPAGAHKPRSFFSCSVMSSSNLQAAGECHPLVFFWGGFLLATSLDSTDDVLSRNHAKMCDHREASLMEYLLEHLLDYLQSRFYKILTPVATSFLARSTYP